MPAFSANSFGLFNLLIFNRKKNSKNLDLISWYQPTSEIDEGLPNGLMTPHDQRRRAALLADSPELSSRPPLNAGGGSGSILGIQSQCTACIVHNVVKLKNSRKK